LIRLVQRRFLKAIGADTKHWQKLTSNKNQHQ
jgi:hypothetical protein